MEDSLVFESSATECNNLEEDDLSGLRPAHIGHVACTIQVSSIMASLDPLLSL